ncbi:MAG TPA: DUF4136 domain-containing protein [Steroidobacteraceae bacterium]
MRHRPWIALGMAAIAACASTWPVDSFEAPEAGIANRRTYAWKGSEFGVPGETDPAVIERADHALRSAVDTVLAHKGYTPAADASSADMLVSYQVAGHRRFVMGDEPRVGGASGTEVLTPGATPTPPASSALPREQSVRDGTVIVFIDDPKSDRLIWRGLINAETRVATTEGAIRQAAEMARQIAEEIPARATKP